MPRSEEQNQEIREKTRSVILASALRLFALKGYHGTSINDIAKDAGISKGLAYNYFESKQKIVEAVLAQAFDETEYLEQGLLKIKDPYEKIKFIIEYYFDMTKNNEEYWRLYFSLALQPEIIETARRITVKFANAFIGYIENMLSSLKLKNAHDEARMFVGLFDGLGLQYLIDKNNFPFEKMKKYFLKRYSKEGIKILRKFNA